jgi:hypothetical protein
MIHLVILSIHYNVNEALGYLFRRIVCFFYMVYRILLYVRFFSSTWLLLFQHRRAQVFVYQNG